MCVISSCLSARLSTHSPKIVDFNSSDRVFSFDISNIFHDYESSVLRLIIIPLVLFHFFVLFRWYGGDDDDDDDDERFSNAFKNVFRCVREFCVIAAFAFEKLIRIDTDAGKFVNFSSDE